MRDIYNPPRSQSAGGRYQRSTRTEPSMENLAPMLMPSGLNSMLKNTTETGDIGMFSIKPTRLPRHNGASTLSSLPKAAYHDLAAQAPDFSLSKVRPRMDDRRRLPSYNRDVTFEIASLYETNSIKSSSTGSRLFDDSEQRSYSMTQTSVNVSRLANHRSYASLRSQGDIGLTQRPRSPFAYPTRLRRPGFRPSSPALTDGVVDYSRRAEIGRESSVSTQLLSAPTQLTNCRLSVLLQQAQAIRSEEFKRLCLFGRTSIAPLPFLAAMFRRHHDREGCMLSPAPLLAVTLHRHRSICHSHLCKESFMLRELPPSGVSHQHHSAIQDHPPLRLHLEASSATLQMCQVACAVVLLLPRLQKKSQHLQHITTTQRAFTQRMKLVHHQWRRFIPLFQHRHS